MGGRAAHDFSFGMSGDGGVFVFVLGKYLLSSAAVVCVCDLGNVSGSGNLSGVDCTGFQ